MTAQGQTRDRIDHAATTRRTGAGLTTAQLIGLLVMGDVLWFVAAMFIRFAGQGLFTAGNPWLIALFVGSLPVAWALVAIPCRMLRVARPHYVKAATLMAAPALLLDGVAITWFPTLYGVGVPGLELAAAWLLWGVGASFVFANLIEAERMPA
jgi:Family of unknown function (DUF5367)